jgi:hypothetical protein
VHGRRRARRAGCRCRVPLRQGRRVRRRRVRSGLRWARGHPVDGPGRVRPRQRRAESFNSTLEFELLSRRHFATKDQARQEVARFIDTYNHRRRHSSCEMLPCRLQTGARPTSRRSGRARLGRVKAASQIAPEALGELRWHQGASDCEAPSAISNPPRFRGKPSPRRDAVYVTSTIDVGRCRDGATDRISDAPRYSDPRASGTYLGRAAVGSVSAAVSSSMSFWRDKTTWWSHTAPSFGSPRDLPLPQRRRR